MGNNEIMAMANARKIEKLPYETLKAMFPSVRYMVQGESGTESSSAIGLTKSRASKKPMPQGNGVPTLTTRPLTTR